MNPHQILEFFKEAATAPMAWPSINPFVHRTALSSSLSSTNWISICYRLYQRVNKRIRVLVLNLIEWDLQKLSLELSQMCKIGSLKPLSCRAKPLEARKAVRLGKGKGKVCFNDILNDRDMQGMTGNISQWYQWNQERSHVCLDKSTNSNWLRKPWAGITDGRVQEICHGTGPAESRTLISS